jgi:23S rRNA C2498 (ribose-2'-O)-methylase RlmM
VGWILSRLVLLSDTLIVINVRDRIAVLLRVYVYFLVQQILWIKQVATDKGVLLIRFNRLYL